MGWPVSSLWGLTSLDGRLRALWHLSSSFLAQSPQQEDGAEQGKRGHGSSRRSGVTKTAVAPSADQPQPTAGVGRACISLAIDTGDVG